MKQCWGLLMLVVLVSCQKDYSESNISVLGHAGESLFEARNEYPPNSIESVQEAIDNGADGVEVDVQLSSDGELVAFHDEFLDDHTNAEGCVNEMSWQELQSVEVYQTDNTISLLMDVIDYPLREGKQVMLDIKHYNFCDESFIDFHALDGALNEILQDYTIEQRSRVWVNSRNATLLRSITDPNVQLSFEYDDVDEAILLNEDSTFDMLSIKLEEVDAEMIEEIKTIYDHVCIYNLISRADVRKALSYGPDFVISDQLAYTIKLTNG